MSLPNGINFRLQQYRENVELSHGGVRRRRRRHLHRRRRHLHRRRIQINLPLIFLLTFRISSN